MEVSAQIKKYRNELNLSQEELAEKVYVSRQTISNWETEKTYPDIHSLLLLGTLFNISLDKLIKGDIEMMEKEIEKEEIKKLKRYNAGLTVMVILSAVSPAPLAVWLKYFALIPILLLWGFTVFLIFKIRRLQINNRIRTYKEIVSFYQGKRLDEIETQRETNKAFFQAFLSLIIVSVSFLVLLTVSTIVTFYLRYTVFG